MPSRAVSFSIPLRAERLGHVARRLLCGEHERDVATEHALEDRADQRVMRAAEDDRVDTCLFQRCRILAHCFLRLLAVRVVPFNERHETGARDREELDACIECVDQLRVAAGVDGALRREQADPPVARSLHGRMHLRRQHGDDRNSKRLLQLRQRGRGRGVASDDDQLHILRLEEETDLAREPAYLLEPPRAVWEARMIAEINEVLMRHRDKALVEDREPADARVEYADGPRIHTTIVE